MSHISIISAVGRNGVIGMENRLPWHLPEDLRHFKTLTMGKPMLMGRKTFESLPGLLPGRRHLVVTRNAQWSAPGAETFSSIEAAVAAAGCEVFVIGGEQIYRQAMAVADRLYLTEVDLTPEGDAHFPELDHTQWREISRDAQVSANGIAFALVAYARI